LEISPISLRDIVREISIFSKPLRTSENGKFIVWYILALLK